MIANRAPYKNAIRSKMLIQDAFLTLMTKTEIFKIKVKDVIELANISKGTFYAHYTCIHDVISEIENEELKIMFCVFDNYSLNNTVENFYLIFLTGLEEIEKKKSFFTILSKNNYLDSFFGKAKDIFIKHMMSNYPGVSSYKDEKIAKAYFTYVAGGAITLMKQWIENNYNPDSDTLAKFINECVIDGINVIKN